MSFNLSGHLPYTTRIAEIPQCNRQQYCVINLEIQDLNLKPYLKKGN